MMQMSRAELYERIQGLPPAEKALAAAACLKKYGDERGQPRKERAAAQRRSYAGRPAAYIREILGLDLTEQQLAVLAECERHDRVLIPKANNIGGTHLLAAFGLYVFDAVAAVLDEEGNEQGARIILMGPDHSTIEKTIYAEMLQHARRAEARGFRMPGRKRSEDSVMWEQTPSWNVEAFSPPKYVRIQQAHSASGRHARVQVAIIEEGSGVAESLWKAVEGMCSSAGNKIIGVTNPTEPVGPMHQRERRGDFKVIHLSAFDHPNVVSRSYVVPGAIDYLEVDRRVRAKCVDRGAFPAVRLEPEYGDFLYALPPIAAEEIGPRTDGHRGHPAGELRVYRPGPQFQGQVLGQWPKNAETGLFSAGAWDAAVERWRAGCEPGTRPDRVGVDAAREGDDDTCTAPAWGLDAEKLLRDYRELEIGMDANGIATMLSTRRARVGEIQAMPKGDGPAVAQSVKALFPGSPWNVDETGVGSSVLDHARTVLGMDASGVSFAASGLAPIDGEPVCENLKATLYVRAAALVRLGLVDLPDDPALREEAMAHELVHGTHTVDEGGVKVRKPSVRVLGKDEVKKKIGRSPDRCDAFVLALFNPPAAYDWWKRL